MLQFFSIVIGIFASHKRILVILLRVIGSWAATVRTFPRTFSTKFILFLWVSTFIIIFVYLIFLSSVNFVLAFHFRLNKFETFFYHWFYFRVWSYFKVLFTEKFSLLITNEIKHHSWGETWYVIAIKAMAIEKTKNLNISIQ